MRLALMAVLVGAAFGLSTTIPAQASKAKPVIALSNAFYGNTWRHQMVDSFEEAAKTAKANGEIADYIIMNGDGSVAQQSSQIGELILKGVDVLLVDAASETAINGVVEKACAAGITVISFDSIASAPCNYQLNFDFKGYKAAQAEAVFKLIGYKGNIIQVRGVKGSAPDNDMYNAQRSVIAKYPDIKVVATVYGQCTPSVAQSAIANVLPSLPHVDAVLGQGPDDIGMVQAFVQYGGEYVGHMPVIEGGGGGDFVRWWAAENKQDGYQSVSMNTTPGISGAAFWLGLEISHGAKVSKKMIMPVMTVDANNLGQYASIPSGQIISPTYTDEWVKKNLLSE